MHKDASDIAKQRREINEAYVRDELRRVDADRLIEDAIRASELTPLKSPSDERILEAIKPHVSSEEFERVAEALQHDRTCKKANAFETAELIRWATPLADLFPNFALRLADVVVVTEALKAHRRMLVKRALQGKTQIEFCRTNKNRVTPDVLRGVVNGDSRRVDVVTWTPTILDRLKIGEKDWNNP
jgi:hypothetical protein